MSVTRLLRRNGPGAVVSGDGMRYSFGEQPRGAGRGGRRRGDRVHPEPQGRRGRAQGSLRGSEVVAPYEKVPELVPALGERVDDGARLHVEPAAGDSGQIPYGVEVVHADQYAVGGQR